MLINEKPEVSQILQKAQDEISTLIGTPCKVIAFREHEVSISETTRRELILREIVSEVTGIKWSLLISKTRAREVVEARQLYCVFAKMFLNYSLKTIGESVGGRDHTTIIHARKTIKDLIESNDETIVSYYNAIAEKLQNRIYESKAQS